MKRFKQIFLREIKRILTSKDLVLICLLAPFIYSFGLSYVYQKQSPKDLKIAVIDKDNSSVSRQYTRMINSTPELNIVAYYTSTYAAYNAIFTNKADLFYFIPKDFSKNLKRSKSTFAFIGANASNFMVSSTAIKTVVGTSQYLSSQVLASFLISKGVSKQSVKQMLQPISTDSKWLFNPTKTYSTFFIPFILFAIFQQIIIVAVCHTMSLETQQNTWKDLYKLSDNKILTLLFAKALPYVFVALFIILSFIFLVLPFANIFQTAKLNLLIISSVYSFVIVFFAMAISHLFKTTVISLCALTFYSMPVLLISGFAWPLYMLPPYLKFLSYLFPSTFFINAFRFYALNDIISLRYASGIILNLVIFFFVCLLINFIILKIKNNKTAKIDTKTR